MSAESLPITPTAFAAALPALSLASLRLKTLELRNSLAHLAYSNAQLRPFADGTATTTAQPDPECADAIRENELVMARMRERILLVRAEVEARGASWREFDVAEEQEEDGEPAAAGGVVEEQEQGGGEEETTSVNGVAAAAAAAPTGGNSNNNNPWTDGTFQMGVIRNGEIRMNDSTAAVPRSAQPSPHQSDQQQVSTSSTQRAAGGSLSDDQLRNLMQARLAQLEQDDDDGVDEEDGGLHL